MKKIYLCTLAVMVLNACSVGVVDNKSFRKKIVSETPLANGGVLTYTDKEPLPEFGCSGVLYQENKNWSKAKVSGLTSFKDGRDVLAAEAAEYSNAHPDQKINYVYMNIPNEINGGDGIIGVPMGSAKLQYYSCKNPPEKHSNPFW